MPKWLFAPGTNSNQSHYTSNNSKSSRESLWTTSLVAPGGQKWSSLTGERAKDADFTKSGYRNISYYIPTRVAYTGDESVLRTKTLAIPSPFTAEGCRLLQ